MLSYYVSVLIERLRISHSIYKWQADKRRSAARPRASSYAGSTTSAIHPTFEHIHEPGGFRRNYLAMKADQRGEERPPMLRNFIEFLYIFGHFVRLVKNLDTQ